MSNIYVPKGSMCGACVNKKLNCASALEFKFMPVMSQYSSDIDVYNVVKCTMFNKDESKEQ